MRIIGRKVRPAHVGRAVICKKALRVDGEVAQPQGAVGILESYDRANNMFAVRFEDSGVIMAHRPQVVLYEEPSEAAAAAEAAPAGWVEIEAGNEVDNEAPVVG